MNHSPLDTKHYEWQKIVAESRKLKELATSGHWVNFLALSEARLKHMKQFFHEYPKNDENLNQLIMDDIQWIKRDDMYIQNLVNTRQEALAGDLGSLQEGIRVVKQYQSFS